MEVENNGAGQAPVEDRQLADEAQLLGIFPEEIWLMIADSTEGADEFLELLNTSLFFRRLLSSRRTMRLFPTVWKVLGNQYETANMEEEPCYSKPPAKLRQVCKSWCQVLDAFYRNYPSIYQMDRDRYLTFPKQKRGEWTNPDRNELETHRDIRRFLKFFESTHGTGERSPWVGNLLHLHLSGRPRSRRFWSKTIKLLEKYGSHIFHLRLEVHDHNPGNETEMYNRICYVLQHAPNLQSFFIFCSDARDYYVTSHRHSNLEHAINLNPLPILAKLRCARFEDLNGLITGAILEKNSHISMLEIKHVEHVLNPALDVPLPKLKETILSVPYRRKFVKLERLVDELQVPWKLEKICFDFRGCKLYWSRLFKLLESHWKDTLTDLMLFMPYSPSKNDEFQVNLPKVERLGLVMQELQSLDFLLDMDKSLEKLYVHFNVDPDREDEWMKSKEGRPVWKQQRLKILGYFNNFYRSNIWELLPKLEMLEFSQGEYYASWANRTIPTPRKWTREGYEAVQN